MFLIILLFGLLLSNTTYMDQVEAEKSNNNAILLDDLTERIILDKHIEVLSVKDFDHPVDEIASDKYNDKFKRYTGKGRPNFGYDLHTYWVRFHINNQSNIENRSEERRVWKNV